MSLTLNQYRLIRANTIKMLYERSAQPANRFKFEDGSLQLYEMIPDEVIERLFNDWKETKSNRNGLNYEYSNFYQKVQFIFVDKVSDAVKNVPKIRESYMLDDNDIIIFVVLSITPIERVDVNIPNVEFFWYKTLCFCITEHLLVPQHILLDTEKRYELIQNLSLENISQLPTVLKDDPVAKWFGAKEGDIFKIIRQSPNVGEHFFYRLVVAMDKPLTFRISKRESKKEKGKEDVMEAILKKTQKIKPQTESDWKLPFEKLVKEQGMIIYNEFLGIIDLPEGTTDIPQIAYDYQRAIYGGLELIEYLAKNEKDAIPIRSFTVDEDSDPQRVSFILDQPNHPEVIAYIIPTVTDGDCFFDSLSKVMPQKSIKDMRNEVADYIEERADEYSMLLEALENQDYIEKKKHISFKRFIKKIRTTKMYVDQLELSAICDLYNINLVVFDVSDDRNLPVINNHHCKSKDGISNPQNVYLYKTDVHYELLVNVSL